MKIYTNLAALLLLAFSPLCITMAQDIKPSVDINHDLRYFADDLTQQLYSSSGNSASNEFSSSFGISLALSLVYPAAKDLSYDQFQAVLRLPPDNSQLVWNDTVAMLQAAYTGECLSFDPATNECQARHPELVIASKVYVDNNQTLDPAYDSIVNAGVDSVESIDMDADTAGGIINEWVSNATRGKIDSIVEDGPLEGLDAAVLTALYLKAAWRDPFDAAHTTTDVFYADASKLTATNEAAQFMHMVEYDMSYSDSAMAGYQLLQLPLGDWSSSLSLILALPMPGNESMPVMAASQDVLAALPNLEQRRVAVSLPKFTVEAKYEQSLEDALKTVGLTEPLDPFCDTLCVFADVCTAYISKLVHKTFLDVNEEGIEAAAVTLLGITMMSMPLPEDPVLFQADHPFQLWVYNSQADLVLFEGRIGNPTVGADTAPPTLTASHNDANFWMEQFSVTVVQPGTEGGNNIMTMDGNATISVGETTDGNMTMYDNTSGNAADSTTTAASDATESIGVEATDTSQSPATSKMDATTTEAPAGEATTSASRGTPTSAAAEDKNMGRMVVASVVAVMSIVMAL